MTRLSYRYVALTDVGHRRTNNEDSGYASSRVLAVADGMGGAAAGELASSTAMNALRALDVTLAKRDSGGSAESDNGDADALAALERTIKSANDEISRIITDNPAVEGMGTTIEAMLFDGEKLAVAHLGDSRMYRLRDNSLTQLSEDHTFVQSLVEEGRISADEARVHPHRSLLLRALLGRDDNDADYSWIQPQLGDRYLLCSDGLSDMVADDAIATALQAETIDAAAVELIDLALSAGGVDNITVVIAEFVRSDDDPDDLLSSADGQPQLVGAASEQPRPPMQRATSSADEPVDEEELRYASRAPGRFGKLRVSLGLVVVLAIVAAAGYAAYQWSQDQYYVGSDGDRVVIYRGVAMDIPGVTLNRVDQDTAVKVEALPAYTRNRVNDGITAEDRSEANQIVADLDSQATNPSPTPTPDESESPTPKETKKPTPRASTAKPSSPDTARPPD